MEIQPQFQSFQYTSAGIEPSRGLNTTIRPLQPLSRLASGGEQPDLTPNIKLRAGGVLLPMSSQAAARSPWAVASFGIQRREEGTVMQRPPRLPERSRSRPNHGSGSRLDPPG